MSYIIDYNKELPGYLKVTGNTDVYGDLFVMGTIGGTLGPLGFPTFVYVGDPLSDFPTLKASIDWLSSGKMSGNTTLVLTADEEEITDTILINLPYQLMITSGGYGQSTLKAGTGLTNKPMFNVASNCSFTKLILDGTSLANYGDLSTESLIRLIGSNYIEVKDTTLIGGYNGINIRNTGEIWAFENIIKDQKNANIRVNVTGGTYTYRSAHTDYWGAPIGIQFVSGVTSYFSSQGDTSKPLNSGSIFLIKPNDTSVSFTDCVVMECIWDSTGTFLSGWDFTRSDGRDADDVFLTNVGIEDQRPHAKINITSNTGTTTFTQNVWTKINFSLIPTNQYLKKMSLTPSGRITYLPTHSKDLMVWVSAAVTTTSQPITITWSWFKNGLTGTTYGTMTQNIDQNAKAFNFSQNIYIPDMKKNEYIELYGRVTTTGEDCVLQDANILIMSN